MSPEDLKALYWFVTAAILVGGIIRMAWTDDLDLVMLALVLCTALLWPAIALWYTIRAPRRVYERMQAPKPSERPLSSAPPSKVNIEMPPVKSPRDDARDAWLVESPGQRTYLLLQEPSPEFARAGYLITKGRFIPEQK